MPRTVRTTFLALLFLTLAAGLSPAGAAEHYVGGGVRFFRTLDDIEIDDLGKIDTDGSSVVLSYLADPAGLFKVEFDLEYFGDGYGEQTGAIVSPQLLVLVGGKLYGGVGAGVNYVDDNLIGADTSDVFYIGRLGLLLTLLPRLHLDLNANYQSDVFDKILDGPTSNSVTLGAMVRIRMK